MTRLPKLTAREIIKALRKVGFEIVPQPEGSHIILATPVLSNCALWSQPLLLDDEVTLPSNKGDIKRGTLESILLQAKLYEKEFRSLI